MISTEEAREACYKTWTCSTQEFLNSKYGKYIIKIIRKRMKRLDLNRKKEIEK